MMAIGMKRQFLGESMAIEISPDPAKRSEQLMANENLIKEANGAMPPMTGSERSLVAMTAIRCNSILCLFMSGVTQKAGCAKRVCGRNGYATIKAEETSGALIVSRKRYHCTILVRRSERRSRSGESGGGQISEFVG